MAIDFSNTEVAFKSKSDKELKKAYWLFKMVGSSTLVNVGKGLTDFALAIRFPIKWAVKPTIFAQFCGGETIEECASTIKLLDKHGVGTILDYSLEGKESDEDLDATKDEIIRTIERAKKDQAIPFAVFKPTGIAKFSTLEKANEAVEALSTADREDYDRFIERMDAICAKAFELKVPLFIDAEDSWIQDTIDRASEEMMVKYNKDEAVIYTTVQMYRWDRLAYLKRLLELGTKEGAKMGVKLVRGAYMEKERERAVEKGYKDPIQPNKEATDRDYDAALAFCVEHINTFAICAGSHNENSANVLVDLLEKHGLDKTDKRIYFAQLLGMSDHISFNLSNLGFNVAKYVPYGPVREVMPYLIRRAQENTSVAGQTSRELNLLKEERKRRNS
jgi:proline dehydrogenase